MKTCFIKSVLLLLLCCGIGRTQELSDGILRFRIKDEKKDELIPGKLVFLQNGIPVIPSVPPADLLVSRDNIIYTANGKGRFQLPAGRYQIWASHGTEYAIEKRRVTIEPNQEQTLEFHLRREVNTHGYIATDLRLHTPSFSDMPVENIAENVIICVAEGLELIAVTDREDVNEYQSIVSKLGLEGRLQIRAGQEILTEFGHFSAYPLPPDLEHSFENPEDGGQLFQWLRQLPTHPMIQVNHPRDADTGYFTKMGLDPDFGVSTYPGGSLEFDVLEVLNQAGIDWYADRNAIAPHQDWYNLLNAGYRVTGVGNSGGHGVLDIRPGLPRNYIASSTDALTDISGDELIVNLRKHHAIVSRGIFIETEVHDGFPAGRQVSTHDGILTFDVSVQAPTWISCDTLKLIANGRVKHTLILKEDRIPERFHGSITVRPTVDTWYVLTATGSRPLAPMYDTRQHALMPLGFTNPIWVDADGDDKFTTVKERAVALLDSFCNDPKTLVKKVEVDAVFLKFVIGYVGTHDFENKSELLEKLLTPANLKMRLRIYEFLSRQQDATAQATLWFRAKTALLPKERLAIALARYRLGEQDQWPVALEHAKRVANKRDVQQAFQTFPTQLKPLSSWQIVGPFEIMQANIFEQVFAPDLQVDLTATHEVWKWKSLKTPQNGHVDLDELYGNDAYTVAYAYTEFNTSASGEMLFKLSSNDGIVIWLNGEEVYRNYATEAPYDLIVLPVKTGKNTFLLRDENRAGDWGFTVEAVDELGWIE